MADDEGQRKFAKIAGELGLRALRICGRCLDRVERLLDEAEDTSPKQELTVISRATSVAKEIARVAPSLVEKAGGKEIDLSGTVLDPKVFRALEAGVSGLEAAEADGD